MFWHLLNKHILIGSFVDIHTTLIFAEILLDNIQISK